MIKIYDDEDNLIDINNLKILSDIGQECKVFKYNDDVIKIFKKDYKLEHISRKTIEYLKQIKTKRILMPTGAIKDADDNLIGYKMKYVHGNKSIDEDYVENLFNELTIIKDDIETLSDKGVRLLDINKNNTIYNGGLYMIDSGNYRIGENMLNENIKVWNYNKVNRLVDSLIFSQKYNPYMFRQIVQFFMKEKQKKNIIYNLDILKQYLDSSLKIQKAIEKFVSENIKENVEEKKLFEKMFIDSER